MRRLLLFVLCSACWLPGVSYCADDDSASVLVTNAEASDDSDITPAQSPPAAPRMQRVGPMITWGNDIVLKTNEETEAVIVIAGNAQVHGKVRGPLVTLFGDAAVKGNVREGVVTILGSVKLGEGARVREPVVAVLGDIDAEADSVAERGAVAIGGRVNQQDGAKILGDLQSIPIPPAIKTWLVQCVLKLRPLAPQVPWVWFVAGMVFVLYLLTTLLFPRPVQLCVAELSNRPATTFFAGLMAKLLVPVVISLLALTVAGLVVVPFLIAALIFGAFVGKAALLQNIGLKFAKIAPGSVLGKPLVALLLGGIVISVLYMIPVLGLLIFMIVSVWGLGGAVTAAFAGMRREIPARRPAPVPPPTSGGAGEPAAGPSFTSEPGLNAPIAPPVNIPDALGYPRARLLERFAAGVLDIILVTMICTFLHVRGFWPVLMLIYFVGMWTWKNTTVGGVILGLKVVRADGARLTLVTALVRGLAAAFSIVVLFLGFLWIAWDREKQGWHDQIAGTLVIRLPRGTPLICA